jgi:alpha-L-rhamnosidase
MMFGEIGAYFYKGLGGIYPDPAKPGYRHIILKPYFVKEMGQFESRFRGPQGEIVSKWQFKGKKVTYTVIIPANSTATLTLPTNVQGEHQHELKAGTHVFTLKVK